MQWLKDFISGFFTYLFSGFIWIVQNIISLLEYLLYCIYDGFLTVIYTFSSALDFSVVAFNMAAQYSHLPPQLIWFINQVNFPQGLSIISGAIGIRMLLNLIPAAFTRV